MAGGVADVAKAVVDPIAKAAGGALRTAVGAPNADKVGSAITAAVNNPHVAPVIKDLTSPKVAGDLNAVSQVANLGATVAGAGAGAEALEDLPAALDKNSPIPKAADKVAAIPAVQKVTDSLSEHYVNSEKESWAKPASTPQVGFKKVAAIFENAASKGNDIPDTLVKNGIKLSDNVEGGKYVTADTADSIRTDAAKMSSELLRPSLQMADYSTPKTPVTDIVKSTINDIKASKGTTPGDIETQIAKAKQEGNALTRKYPDGMSLTDMHDTKIDYASNGKYSPVGDTNVNNIAGVNRAFGRTLASQVETKAPAGVPVKEFNAELAKQYQAADYLDALDSKKVPQSIMSKIAKTAAKVAGAAVGDSLGGGILGGVGGYHIGGMVESMLENMPNPIKGHFLNTLEMTNPPAFEAVKSYMGDEQMAQLQRRMLPAPTTIYQKPKTAQGPNYNPPGGPLGRP